MWILANIADYNLVRVEWPVTNLSLEVCLTAWLFLVNLWAFLLQPTSLYGLGRCSPHCSYTWLSYTSKLGKHYVTVMLWSRANPNAQFNFFMQTNSTGGDVRSFVSWGRLSLHCLVESQNSRHFVSTLICWSNVSPVTQLLFTPFLLAYQTYTAAQM